MSITPTDTYLEQTHQGTAPMPPPTPGVPIEHHPYNDDWGTTFVAILLMSLIVFAALGILVRNSFRLVPTGVMALQALVSERPPGYHRVAGESDDEADVPHQDSVDVTSPADNRRLELLSDSEDELEDARILRIDSPAEQHQ
ncbi:hypothetical protein GGF46_000559 [Coemansia sp. RSA 552]|nr:hypothetical protein GGF46_000559 [Coemansia sp. RSA 552]